ncbi:DUF4386 domain-containing protein [Pinirhizobacter soli]|uniref:DUF4386 domain-containing protein n=1 Tax=Pinirhizobacter soli TaxID=2786953 RepID=UPI00202A9F6B|nr:DUF4386 domain-containing protein [Pinirhizobacter soli]
MTSIKRDARVAGFIYLLLALTGPFRLMYIPEKLFVHGNAAATAANVTAHDLLFRWGIAVDVLVAAISVFVILALYRLFKPVTKSIALCLLVLGLMNTPLYMATLVTDIGTLAVVTGSDVLTAFSAPQRDSLISMFIRMHGLSVTASETFWGLWLLPLAILVFRSGFLPRFLGVWLALNGVAYIVVSMTGLLWPSVGDLLSDWAFPFLFGEIAFLLWLLVVGARPKVGASGTPMAG